MFYHYIKIYLIFTIFLYTCPQIYSKIHLRLKGIIKLNSHSEPQRTIRVEERTNQNYPDENKRLKNHSVINAAPISRRNQKVKDDKRLFGFMVYIHKYSLKFLEALETKTKDDFVKTKLAYVIQKYKKIFLNFIRTNKEAILKTGISKEKFVLNTIDTSTRLLTKLINYVIAESAAAKSRDNEIINVLEKALSRRIAKEYQDACKLFKICRQPEGFNNFVIKLLSELLKNDNEKILSIVQMVARTLKNIKVPEIIASNTKMQMLVNLDRWQTNPNIRQTLEQVRTIMATRNVPYLIPGEDMRLFGRRIHATYAIHSLMDSLDELIPVKKDEWDQILTDLQKWTTGEKLLIQSTIDMFFDLVVKAIPNWNAEMRTKVRKKLKLVISGGTKPPSSAI